MSLKSEIHPIQAAILRVLHYRPQARFSELNTDGIPSDHFNFHVKKLLELGLIEKTGDQYQLTAAGKEFTNRFDTDSAKIALERQAKIGVLVVGVRGKGEKTEYLVQQRLKQPYYGFHGFMTGKLKWGETVLETASRELQEETGLTGRLALVGIKHKMDYAADGALLEDKYFFIVKAEETDGKLVERFEGGRNVWLTKEEILKLPDLFHGVEETIEMANKGEFVFIERKYKVARY